MTEPISAAQTGVRLRRVRKSKGLTLKAVATEAGISESFLSQVENGRAAAAFNTLLRILGVLDVSLTDLFRDSATDGRVVRFASAANPSHQVGEGVNRILSPPRSKRVQLNYAVIEPGESTRHEMYTHDAVEEIVYVISGEIEIWSEGETHHLGRGDTLLLDPRLPHGYANTSDLPAETLWFAVTDPVSEVH